MLWINHYYYYYYYYYANALLVLAAFMFLFVSFFVFVVPCFFILNSLPFFRTSSKTDRLQWEMKLSSQSSRSCLAQMIKTCKICRAQAAESTAFSLEWIYSHSIGVVLQGFLGAYHVIPSVSPLTIVASVVLGVLLLVLLRCVSRMFSREELWNMYDIIMCLFTAELSFLSLMLDGVWFLGQTLDAFCKLLTLEWMKKFDALRNGKIAFWFPVLLWHFYDRKTLNIYLFEESRWGTK